MSSEKDTMETVRLTDDQLKQRRRRSLFIALGLVGLVVLFYLVTLLRFGDG